MSATNPGIERGMTAVPHHNVESTLHLSMRWADAEALFITLNNLDRQGLPPSHEPAITALRDLLAERIYVIRSVVTRPSRATT